jgi:AraC-like DNA-binding protein
LPGSEIVNEHYDAGDVLGQAIKEMRARMAETTCFRDRVVIADEYLTGFLPRVSPFSGIDAAAREILCAQGCVRVDDVAHKSCLSVRQFERNFSEKVGIRPKLYARIVRFEAAIERRAADPTGNWTTIAHELGYHDQMHMIHDFHLLSGENPTVLVKQLEPIGSDAIQVI